MNKVYLRGKVLDINSGATKTKKTFLNIQIEHSNPRFDSTDIIIGTYYGEDAIELSSKINKGDYILITGRLRSSMKSMGISLNLIIEEILFLK